MKNMLPGTEHPTMGSSTLHFAYSFACDLACEHCIFRSGPGVDQTMGIARAHGFIEQAGRAGIRTLVFTGGEPFLRPGELRILMQHAAQHGMGSAVITNGAWASSRQKVRTCLGDLKEAGLRSITLSTDRYHLPGVPLENLTHVLAVAREAGLRTGVKISRLPRDPVAEGLYRALRGQVTEIVVQEVSPMGRGASLRAALHRKSASSFLGNGCPAPPLLLPDGNLLTCCNLPARDMGQEDAPLVLGNAETEPLRSLLRKRSTDPLLTLLRTRGPSFLLALLARRDSSSRRHAGVSYHSACDLCFHLFSGSTDTHGLYASVRDARDPDGGEPV